MTEWDDVAVVPVAGQRFVELPASGWGAFVGYAAGIGRMVRCADVAARQTVTSVHDRTGRLVAVESRPSTPEERTGVEDDIDEYLALIGIPPRPRSFLWFLLLPDRLAEQDFWAAIFAKWRHGGQPTADWLPDLRRIVEPLYET
jgi:hypothetical protein